MNKNCSRGKKLIILRDVYDKEKAKIAGAIEQDPVVFVHKYKKVLDQEIAGFMASQFAYGNIKAMKQFMARLFDAMGESPYAFVRKGDFSSVNRLYYRFQKGEEIIDLFETVRRIINDYGSIGAMFKAEYKGDIREALWSARERYFNQDPDRLIFFFPKRSPTNPLKRWNLYLRWMVRKDAIDIGIWPFIERKDLIIPLDTHLYKIGRCLGWTSSRTQSWKAACDITAALRKHSPADPLKYDFFLCHMVGIEAGCTGSKGKGCAERCRVYEI
ncbi:MAG TPA: TIGR02757 family protein [Syntrophorhabdales bacterium]|nr:TIGR02757 family protein [Syntrophorhabdales bacterium]